MDPVETVIVTAVVSGAAKTLVDKATNQASHWLKDRFANHSAKANAAAVKNASDFMNELGQRVQRLEQTTTVLDDRISDAMSQPDFSVLMQQAILSAAQTGQRSKHVLLADIVADRLRVDGDSVQAMAAQLAVDAIAHMTSRQLMLLGFYYTVEHLQPLPAAYTVADIPPLMRQSIIVNWLQIVFKPYAEFDYDRRDLKHLIALGCLGAHLGFFSSGLDGMLARAIRTVSMDTNGDFVALHDAFVRTELGTHIRDLWDKGLNGTDLNSTGSLVGMYVANQLAGLPTDVSTWEG